MTTLTFNAYYTLIAAVLVLLLGSWLVRKIKFLQDFNIPEPVAGGLVAALVLFGVHTVQGVNFQFEKPLQDAFMLVFFSSIGLSADFARLRQGGRPLVIFIIVVSAFIIVQNVVGTVMASMLGLDARIGLVAGSITLTGGHGTAGAWGKDLEAAGVQGAITLGMACATFGLVMGGLLGGPVARRLIRGKPTPGLAGIDDSKPAVGDQEVVFERPHQQRLITAESGLQTLAMFAACLAFSDIMFKVAQGTWYQLPQFVWALAGGVLVRNGLVLIFGVNMFDRAIDVFGNIALSLFLAMALLSLKLWELAGLAVPVMFILAAQTVVMALYATYVTYRAMGSDYDAAVLAAGHCGFGLGATPTAVANMQALTDRFGPSHKAFLIVPMVGAFFVDIVNALLLQGALKVIAWVS